MSAASSNRPSRRPRAPLAFVFALACLLLVPGSAMATGELTQKSGTAGCISFDGTDGTGGACQLGRALGGLQTSQSIAVSPDGKNAYAASLSFNAIDIFDRDPVTGTLTQKAGTAGCISSDGSDGNGNAGVCQQANGLSGPAGIVVSPDGANVYVVSVSGFGGTNGVGGANGVVAIFDRDPTTGALTQPAGTAACVSAGGVGDCQQGNGLDTPQQIAFSPDGKSVYVTTIPDTPNSDGTGVVAIFDRDPTTGALTQKAGTAGCLSNDGTGGYRSGPCQMATGIDYAGGVVVSPDGNNVYVGGWVSGAASSGDVAILDRDATGALTQPTGTAACISGDGSGGACQQANAALQFGSQDVALSPDGRNVYVPALAGTSSAEAILDRNTTSGALTAPAGPASCISGTGSGGACQVDADLDLTGGSAVTVSPDGYNVYAVGYSGVTTMDRDSTSGALSAKAGTVGCVSPDGSGGACQQGRAISGAGDLTMSPDGKSAYVASSTSNAVAIFDRNAPPPPTPPDTTITSGPAGTTTNHTPTFTFTSSVAGSTFECQVDNGTWTSCSSPYTTPALADGSHTFAVRAIDPATGETDPTPASVTFTVSSPPMTSATPPSQVAVTPSAVTLPASGAVTLAASRVGVSSARLNGRVDTGGRAGAWQFQFGTSSSYNKGTPLQTISAGTRGISVSWVINRLSADTVYHYRVVLLTGAGTASSPLVKTYGRDMSFRTGHIGRLLLVARRLRVSGGRVLATLQCASRLACNGRFSITTRARLAGSHALATIDCTKPRSTFFRIKAHATKTVNATVPRGCLSVLRSRHQLQAKFTSRPRTAQQGIITQVLLILR